MTSSGGQWVPVPVPDGPDRWDFVPAEQPESPDGGPGTWHVVGGSGSEVGEWEWFPGEVPPHAPPAAPAPPPPPPAADIAAWTPGAAGPVAPEPLDPWPVMPGPVTPEPIDLEPLEPGSATAAPGAAEPVPPVPAAWEAVPPVPEAWEPLPASAWEPPPASAWEPPPASAWESAPDEPVVAPPASWSAVASVPAQAGFPVPPPTAWHDVPPPAPSSERSRKVPLAIVGGVLAAAVIAVVAVVALSGGDDGKNEEEITALVNFVTTADDGAEVCSSHLTENFVSTVFGDVETCERDDDSDGDDGDASGATVTDFEFEDDEATALVTVTGGDTDGATGTWAFRKGEDDVWRVSEWRADYLRSSFEKTFGENYASEGSDDPFDDTDVRSCVKDKLLGQDDAAFLDTAYQLFRNSDASTERLLGFMSDCPSDVEGVSALRALFEKGFRASAQLPPEITDCIVLGMRTGLSDDEIEELSLRRDDPAPEDVRMRLEEITVGCAGDSAQFDPTPDDLGAATPEFDA